MKMEQYGIWVKVIEIVVITGVIYLFYNKFIKGSSSERLVRGAIGLIAIWAASFIFGWMGLSVFETFTRWIALFLSVGLLVIFQPELRKFFGMMGNVGLLKILFLPRFLQDETKKNKMTNAANEIAMAAEQMSRTRMGGLMVLQNGPIVTVEKYGTKLNADVSSALLLTIFHDKTPLHDGAVIIYRSRILSAGAILPLTGNSNSGWKFGTRHRAAIGQSENTGDSVLVISEETGNISIAYNGNIKKFEDPKKLRAAIEKALI
jgi:diadenylate cyclase